MAATALAVETAVLHNFVWHERTPGSTCPGAAGAMSPGACCASMPGTAPISILGNLALMRLFVGTLHMNHYVASVMAIALCSLLNFAASEWFVFRK